MHRYLSRDRDRGFTLIELLVSMVILGIVMTLISVALRRVAGGTEGAADRMINLEEARLLMDTMTKDVRTAVDISATAPAFVMAAPRRVIFYGNLNSTSPRLIDIFVDSNNRLTECVSPVPATPPAALPAPNTTSLACPTGTSVRIVGSFIAGSAPIFKYYDTANALLTIAAADETNITTTGPLTKIGSVEITISIQKTSRRFTNVTTLTDKVRLPNILNNLTT